MLPIENDLVQIGRFQHPPGGHALSLYLETDPARAQGPSLRAQLDDELSPIRASLEGDEAGRKRLEMAVHAAVREISALAARPRAVAAFVSDDLRFVRIVPLPERVEPTAHWGSGFHVKPLLAALDEYERTIVVLVDQALGRVYRVFMGEIEEVAQVTGEPERDGRADSAQHSGEDAQCRGRGAAYGEWTQRRRDGWHVRQHAERVLVAMRGDGPWPTDRVFVGGSQEGVIELLYLLPKRVRDRSRLISRIGPETDPESVLARVLEVQHEAEREEEEEMLDNLTERDRDRSVFGAVAVAEAVADSHVHTLVYGSDSTIRGAECARCGWLAAGPLGSTCPRCEAEMVAVPDLLERMLSRVLRAGGRVEEVRGPALKTLNRLGSVAALLRHVPADDGTSRSPPRASATSQ